MHSKMSLRTCDRGLNISIPRTYSSAHECTDGASSHGNLFPFASVANFLVFTATPIPTPCVMKPHNTGGDINIRVISKTIYTSSRQPLIRQKD